MLKDGHDSLNFTIDLCERCKDNKQCCIECGSCKYYHCECD